MPTQIHFHNEEVSEETIILEGNMSDTAVEDDNSEHNQEERKTMLTDYEFQSRSNLARGSGPPSLPLLNRSRMMTRPSFNF